LIKVTGRNSMTSCIYFCLYADATTEFYAATDVVGVRIDLLPAEE
jgi:hypothetical protein